MPCRTRIADESWMLPIPAPASSIATIALAFVDVDYRNRLEPTEILSVLQALAEKAKHIQIGIEK
jgi:hypothetical protein